VLPWLLHQRWGQLPGRPARGGPPLQPLPPGRQRRPPAAGAGGRRAT